ncbi:MAG: hypothetical protein NT013_29475 [Planctomycetia bacterium]|nr:hypothetical protein [Planctomycetia bacterium]
MADDVAPKSGQAKASPKQLSERINLKNADGQRTHEIKPESNGAKLVGADAKEIARYSVSEHTLKIKDAADKVLGHIVRHDDAYKIEDADRKNVLFKIAGKSNGDWSVEDGKQERLYRIKKRDYGFEIESVSGASLAKVKLKDGKTSLRNAKDETLFSTKDHVSQLGLACVSLEKINSEPLRFGLLVQLTIDGRL